MLLSLFQMKSNTLRGSHKSDLIEDHVTDNLFSCTVKLLILLFRSHHNTISSLLKSIILHNIIVCLNTVKYVQDWEERINFALNSHAIYRLVFQKDQHAPVVYLELTSNQKIKQMQRSTGNFLLVDMGWGKVEANLGDIISAFPKPREIAINFVWSSRRIKHFCQQTGTGHLVSSS